MRTMLAALVATAAVHAAGSAAAAAPIYPWCTTGASQEFGARNCGFVSFEQCMQTARGNGQNCDRNPFYVEPPAPVARPKARKSHTK